MLPLNMVAIFQDPRARSSRFKKCNTSPSRSIQRLRCSQTPRRRQSAIAPQHRPIPHRPIRHASRQPNRNNLNDNHTRDPPHRHRDHRRNHLHHKRLQHRPYAQQPHQHARTPNNQTGYQENEAISKIISVSVPQYQSVSPPPRASAACPCQSCLPSAKATGPARWRRFACRQC